MAEEANDAICDCCRQPVEQSDYAAELTCGCRACGRRWYHQSCLEIFLKRTGDPGRFLDGRATGYPCPAGKSKHAVSAPCPGRIFGTHRRPPKKKVKATTAPQAQQPPQRKKPAAPQPQHKTHKADLSKQQQAAQAAKKSQYATMLKSAAMLKASALGTFQSQHLATSGSSDDACSEDMRPCPSPTSTLGDFLVAQASYSRKPKAAAAAVPQPGAALADRLGSVADPKEPASSNPQQLSASAQRRLQRRQKAHDAAVAQLQAHQGSAPPSDGAQAQTCGNPSQPADSRFLSDVDKYNQLVATLGMGEDSDCEEDFPELGHGLKPIIGPDHQLVGLVYGDLQAPDNTVAQQQQQQQDPEAAGDTSVKQQVQQQLDGVGELDHMLQETTLDQVCAAMQEMLLCSEVEALSQEGPRRLDGSHWGIKLAAELLLSDDGDKPASCDRAQTQCVAACVAAATGTELEVAAPAAMLQATCQPSLQVPPPPFQPLEVAAHEVPAPVCNSFQATLVAWLVGSTSQLPSCPAAVVNDEDDMSVDNLLALCMAT